MKILIVHPSRGRPEQALEAARHFVSKMRSGVEYKYVFALDSDDPDLQEYVNVLNETKDIFVVRDNRGVVEAINKSVSVTIDDEDIIVKWEDDCTIDGGWDVKLLDFIATIKQADWVLEIPDVPKSNELIGFIVMSASLYRYLGYVYHPDYLSMYADNDLYERSKAVGALIRYGGLPIGLVHHHPTLDSKVRWDDTYLRENSKEAYEIGQKMLEKHRALNFEEKISASLPS